MENQVNKTKANIQETALNLFSQRGYSAVSIRDICKEVGIKESTVYYHFKNKQDIFKALLREFEGITSAIQGNFDSGLNNVSRIEEKPFVEVGLAFLNGYFLEERILKFLRMLMIEQHVNKEAANLYQQILFEAPLKQNTEVFEMLIEKGCFKNADTCLMAIEYYAPILFVFQRYFATGEITIEKREKANGILTGYLMNFYKRYSIF